MSTTPMQQLLLLLVGVPPTPSSLRVRVWRRLRSLGAVPLKRSAYLFPDTPDRYDDFQWLAQEIQRDGGERTLVRVHQIENLNPADVLRLIHEPRDQDNRPAGRVRVRAARGVSEGRHRVRRARRGAEPSRRGLHVRDADQARAAARPPPRPPRRDRSRGGPPRRQVPARGGPRHRRGDPRPPRRVARRPPGAGTRHDVVRGPVRDHVEEVMARPTTVELLKYFLY